MSDELVGWLRQQLDEDEQVARIVSDGGYDPQTWRAGPDGPGHVGVLIFGDDHMIGDPPDAIEEADGPLAVVLGGRAEHRHIARWDPARVVAEVEAKRERLDWIEGQLRDDPADETAQWLAKVEGKPYADRPGWREEWRA